VSSGIAPYNCSSQGRGALALLLLAGRTEPSRACCHLSTVLTAFPLAIEFAAARAAMLGPELVLSRLDKRFGLLTGGLRNRSAATSDAARDARLEL